MFDAFHTLVSPVALIDKGKFYFLSSYEEQEVLTKIYTMKGFNTAWQQ